MAELQNESLDREHYVKEVAGIHKLMADEKEMTDVILSCGEKKISAHKVILAGASSYFRAMFRNECKETVENIIELPTVTENTLTIILDFIYSSGFTQICWKSVEETIDVLKVAHLFEMKPLFSICCRQLVETLTPENCLEFWKLSNLYQDEIFKTKIFKFIKRNLDELVKDEALLQMDASDFTLLMSQIKVTEPSEYFKNSILDWIMENREERQSLIPLLGVNNLSKETIESFLEKNELSDINIKFLKQVCETGLQADQYENSRELGVPLSSLKILLYGIVGKQVAYQIVDFSGRSNELKILPLISNDLNELELVVSKGRLYILTMKHTPKVPFYEVFLNSGKIYLRQPMINKDVPQNRITNQTNVIDDSFYVWGRWFNEDDVWKPFLKYHDMLKDTWVDITHVIWKFSAIDFGMKFKNYLLLIGKNTTDQYAYMKIDRKPDSGYVNCNACDLPLSRYFWLKTAFCHNEKLFLISNGGLVVHNLNNNSSELRINSYEPTVLLNFNNYYSLNCVVEKNESRSEDEEWSHRLVNFTNGQVITEILVQTDFYKSVAFVSDFPTEFDDS